MHLQKSPKSQTDPEKGNQSWGYHNLAFRAVIILEDGIRGQAWEVLVPLTE